jgi:signal transduction histidine kinase
MLDRIEALVENLREVSSDIAHDLRTPLARLRNRLESGALAIEAGPAAGIIDDAILRVDEVLSLFAAILRIAEVESGETRRRFEQVEMSALVLELAESYAPAIQDGGRTLLWSVEPALTVVGDRELIAQAGVNLLENAQRHTPEGTIIRMTLTAVGRSVCLRVVDNGPGVARSQLGWIVKRFARLDQSRSTAGYGLGLNLVSAIARLHGGKLMLQSDGGFSATLQLPQPANLELEHGRQGAPEH